MKRIFILFLWVISNVSAQDTPELFTKANELYENGKYNKALDLYKTINNNVSSELYYNLGNCYYKLNNVAQAIYNYEKALKLNKSNIDAKNNLFFANRLTADKIKPLPKKFSHQLDEKFLQQLSFETWGILAIICSFLGSTLFLFYYFSKRSNKKRFFFTGSIINFTLSISTLIIGIQQHNQTINNTTAIIFSKEIKILKEPVNSADTVFRLHEGTKVKIIDTVDDWKKIEIANGKIGWMLSKGMKAI